MLTILKRLTAVHALVWAPRVSGLRNLVSQTDLASAVHTIRRGHL